MNGKIEYTSPINNEPFFRLINFENEKLYAVELISLSGNVLSDPDWIPGDTGHALFAITKDEFDLKDTDENGLKQLISELYSKIPEDRLIESYYVSAEDHQRKKLRLRTKCATMDNNKYEDYRQRLYSLEYGIPFLNAAEKVYMIYDKTTTDILPALTWDNYANIFTKREYADAMISKAEISTLDIKEFDKADFDKHIKTWHAFGIINFNLNAGTKDHACSMKRDDYMPDPLAKEWEYSGSALCMYIWRYRQYIGYKSENMQALARTIYNAFCHELKNTLFLCPFLYGSEERSLSQPDYAIHTSQGSVDLITKKSLGKYLDDPALLQSEHEYVVEVNGEKVMLSNGNLKFYGGEKYQLAGPSNANPGRQMNLLTVNGGDGAFIPAFTDFATLHSIFGENVRVSIYTYNELCAIAKNDASLNGVVINPNSTTMPIWKKDFDLIEKISKEPNTIYIPKSQTESKEDEQTAAVPDQPQSKIDQEPMLDDITYIRDIKHTISGVWHQYDILLAARPYGWDDAVNWADYMADADIVNISTVTYAAMGCPENEIIDKYRSCGNKLSNISDLNENSSLAIGGVSVVLRAQIKMVWLNQTRVIRIFTTIDDELLVKKYAETAVCRTFGTPEEMRIGKPIPEGENVEGTRSASIIQQQKKEKTSRGRKVVLVLIIAAIVILVLSINSINNKRDSAEKLTIPESEMPTAAQTGIPKAYDVPIVDITDLYAVEIKGIQTVYVVYDKDKGLNTPYCDSDNCIIITDKETYDPMFNSPAEKKLALHKFSHDDFIEYLKKIKGQNIQAVSFNKYAEGSKEKLGMEGYATYTVSIDKILSD